MSDFLSRLAERALKQAPVVEPLVRSRYDPVHEFATSDETVTEPVAQRATMSPTAPKRADDSPVESMIPSAVEPRTVAQSRPDGTVAFPLVEGTRPAGGPKVEPVSAPARREHRSDALSRPAAQAISSGSPRQGAAQPAPHPPASRPAAADDVLDAGETFTAAPVPARQPHTPEVADVSSPPADAGEAASPRADVARDAASRESDAPAAVAVSARAPKQPQLVAEASPPRSTRPTQRLRPEPEPVRVTIGRIEVVAPSPAPPPVPAVAATSAPRLSLDEYLRTRGGLKR